MSYKPRYTKLYNLYTKETIEAESMGEFCRKAGLNGNDKYHINPILDGVRLHHKGWVLPDFIETKETICDIYGNEYKFEDVIDVYKRNKLGINSIKKLIDGKIDFYKGLFIKSNKPLFKKKTKLRFIFEKDEKRISSSNISALSRKFGVNSPRHFYSAINGERNSCYGYKLKKIESFIPKKKLIKYI